MSRYLDGAKWLAKRRSPCRHNWHVVSTRVDPRVLGDIVVSRCGKCGETEELLCTEESARVQRGHDPMEWYKRGYDPLGWYR